MMLSKTTKSRPDACTTHGPEGAVTTAVRGTGTTEWDIQERLTQHRCAEGCGEYLGWEFHGPGGEFQHGTGRCADQDILGRMEQAAFGEEHECRMIAFGGSGMIVLTTLGVVIIMIFPQTIVLTGLAALGAWAAGFWWLRRSSLRSRPEPRG